MTAKPVLNPIKDHNQLANLTVGDVHTQYLFLAGRSGGQIAYGGTGAGEELILRGTTNANLGQVRLRSPIDFDDVTAANALNPYSVRDASSATFTAAFIGGTYSDQRTITFSNSLFIYETLRGSPSITSGVNPTFAAFTLFQASPVLASGASSTFNPLQALVLNVGTSIQHQNTGTRTCPNATAVNSSPVLVTTIANGQTLNLTNCTGLVHAPRYNTAAGTTVSFGTIRAVHAQVPTVALFGSAAGTETMTAYYALDVDNIGAFGGTASVAAVRSAITSGTNQWFLYNTGGASSEFGAGIIHLNNAAPIQFGGTLGSANASAYWNDSSSTFDIFFWNTSRGIRFSAPATDRFLFNSTNGATGTEFNFNCAKFSLGTQTGAVGNQVGVFVAGTRTTGVNGDWSDFLLTQGGTLTVANTMGTVAGWTINSPSMSLSGGSVTTATGLYIAGNVNQGTNRYGLYVLSSPSGGTLNYCARFQGAAGVRIDGVFEHAGSTFGVFGTTPATQAAAYTPTNVTTDRSYDADATTVAELADVLGTLIADLQSYGLLQ